MAYQRGMRRVGLTFIQQSFEPACRPIEEEGFDSGSHVILLPQRSAVRNTGRRQELINVITARSRSPKRSGLNHFNPCYFALR